jgi:hypothetical protein
MPIFRQTSVTVKPVDGEAGLGLAEGEDDLGLDELGRSHGDRG